MTFWSGWRHGVKNLQELKLEREVSQILAYMPVDMQKELCKIINRKVPITLHISMEVSGKLSWMLCQLVSL